MVTKIKPHGIDPSLDYTFDDVTANTVTVTSGIIANGTLGTAGQVLTSNGSATYWVDANLTGGGGSGVFDVTVDTFTGNGSNTEFTLSTTPASIDATLVTINGIQQNQTEYTIDGQTLEFTEAITAGATIEVRTFAGGAKGEKGATGDVEAQGNKGDKGDQGIPGTAVAKGDKGDIGSAGATGAKGDTGATGSKGDKGDIGSTGATGAKGDTGATGSKGDKGDVGTKGDVGSKGDKGEVGVAGADGAAGSKGDKGEVGVGVKGDKGDVGSTGSTGSAGAKGDKGDLGTTGSTGTKGDKGIEGTKGQKGDAGSGGGGARYITMTRTGAVTSPFYDTSRYYPPANVSIESVTASLSVPSATTFTFRINKNGSNTGLFSINSNEYLLSDTAAAITLTTTDYLTVDVISGAGSDLRINLLYT